MTKKYRALIAGAGNIGAHYDSPGSKEVLTYGHLFSIHSNFSLCGFIDTDAQKVRSAVNRWGGRAFTSLEEALQTTSPDILVVATPDDQHYSCLMAAVGEPLQLVVAEKPLATSREEALRVVAAYRDRDLPLAVNYSRRFVPEFIALTDIVRNNHYGRFMGGTGYYGKGSLHNGTHLIDLLRFLVGDIEKVTAAGGVEDYSQTDPSAMGILHLKSDAKFVLVPIDSRRMTVFEADLFFEQGRIRIVDGGYRIDFFEIQENKVYAGYRNPIKVAEQKTSLGESLRFLADSLALHLTTKAPLPCTGDEALPTLDVALQLIEGLKT
jgi:predicted dehydrogenase